MTDQVGPRVRVWFDCMGCTHYEQGQCSEPDYCNHPDVRPDGKKRDLIDVRTPVWCPHISEAKYRLFEHLKGARDTLND